MKRLNIVSPIGITFAAALAATATAGPANKDFIVAITDESNVDAQQSAARLTLRSLPNAQVDVRLAAQNGEGQQFRARRLADGRIDGDDRFLECYNLAQAVVNAARRAQFAPTSLPITVGLMSTAAPLNVSITRTSDATLGLRAISRGVLSDGTTSVPAGVALEGTVGFDGNEPTSATIRETAYAGYTSLPAHATTCRMAPVAQQA